MTGERSEVGPGSLKVTEYQCCICLELLVDPVVGSCGHDFCKHCIERWKSTQLKNGRVVRCPVCRGTLLPCPSQSFGVCRRLRTTVERLFPEESERRRKALRESEAQDGPEVEGARAPLRPSLHLLCLLTALRHLEADMVHGGGGGEEVMEEEVPEAHLGMFSMAGNAVSSQSPGASSHQSLTSLSGDQVAEAVASFLVSYSQDSWVSSTRVESPGRRSPRLSSSPPSVGPSSSVPSLLLHPPAEVVQLACLTAGYLPGLYQVVLRSPLLTHLVPQFQHLLCHMSDTQVLGGGISEWRSTLAPQVFLSEIEILLVRALVAARSAGARDLLQTLAMYVSAMYNTALQLAHVQQPAPQHAGRPSHHHHHHQAESHNHYPLPGSVHLAGERGGPLLWGHQPQPSQGPPAGMHTPHWQSWYQSPPMQAGGSYPTGARYWQGMTPGGHIP